MEKFIRITGQISLPAGKGRDLLGPSFQEGGKRVAARDDRKFLKAVLRARRTGRSRWGWP